MKNIKVLPEGLIDRIAAGEVIENPASVIKELLENSLDASAKNLEISVSQGGKEEILIVDDGEGIPKDQVEIAFLRHATSKIKSFEDLLKTGTMGFRGEAMPSISSISIMELSTCSKDENVGTRIRFEGGKQTHFGPAPPKIGCSISVRNLFYNVPARRKFLKSENSEKRKISETIRRYVIGRPDVGFKISYDGKTKSSFPPTDDHRGRLAEVWGRNIAEKLLPVDLDTGGPVRVFGFISPPDISRGNRGEIFFFVNGRPVIEKAMFGAIAASYEGALPRGQYPYAAVFLDIDPGFVDINVHPAKIEVRFSDTGYIFATLKNALKNAISLPIGIPFRKPDFADESGKIPFERARKDLFAGIPVSQDTFVPSVISDEIVEKENVGETLPDGIDHPFQIFNTYIVARKGDEIIILDQHTVHERVLFEKTLESINNRPSPSQKLLFESRVKLTPEEFGLVGELEAMLEKAGFEIRPFGDNEVILSGVPQEFTRVSPETAIKELLVSFLTYRENGEEAKSALAAAVACKAAVKAGDKLSEPQMRGLYSDLLRCKEPFRCPHGRPTVAALNRNDLERIFLRK
ncbi:MAG: DNA mismatch repair endonuclease MutL [candidate division Zixibacteria bacterium]